MILDKCLDEQFVQLLEPGGSLDFVIPMAQHNWRSKFLGELSIEIREGNVLEVASYATRLLRMQFQGDVISVHSDLIRNLATIGWLNWRDEGEIERCRQLIFRGVRSQRSIDVWLRSRICAARIELPGMAAMLLNQDVLVDDQGREWIPIDHDSDADLLVLGGNHEILVLLVHHTGWDGLELSLFRAARMRQGFEKNAVRLAQILERLAEQKMRLGLLARNAEGRIATPFDQISLEVVAIDPNVRSGRRHEIISRASELIVPLYGWKIAWGRSLRRLV